MTIWDFRQMIEQAVPMWAFVALVPILIVAIFFWMLGDYVRSKPWYAVPPVPRPSLRARDREARWLIVNAEPSVFGKLERDRTEWWARRQKFLQSLADEERRS